MLDAELGEHRVDLGLVARADAAGTAAHHRSPLPRVGRVQLIGRDRDLQEIGARLDDGRRLVSLTGPGGVGKTTLARVAIGRFAPAGTGGTVVELTRVDRPDAVPGMIATRLGFSTFDVLLSAPPEQPGMVLVDNCEHVLDGAAAAIDRLLDAWRTVRLVATSRSPLGLTAESVVTLDPLAVPMPGALDPRTDAVLLFCERARDNGVAIDDADLDAVVELCRRLDGMPLAIELAAARLRTLGITDLVRRVGEGVDLLARQRHRGDARHRSVRDTIVWSSRLLDDGDRAAFGHLGVCVGPFDIDAAAAMIACPPADAVNVVERLVDASLIAVERDRSSTRLRMLEPVRAVALDQLDRAGLLAATRERLATHVYEASAAMLDEAVVRWDADLLPTLLARFDQIDVALHHCLAHDEDPRRALLLYGILWGVVHQARVDEILALGSAVIDRWPDPAAPHGADAAATYAMAMLLSGRTEPARHIATAALDHTDASVLAAPGLRRVLALADRLDGDHRRAAERLAEAAEAAAQRGIVTVDLECQAYRAQDLAESGRAEEALEIVRAVTVRAREQRSILNEIWARTVEASVLAGLGDQRTAIDVAGATLLVSRAIAYPFGIICNLQTVAEGHLAAGELADAADTAEDLLDAVERSGSGDFRRALDVAIAVLATAGHEAVPPLAATAGQLPDTNPMLVHLPPVEPPRRADALDRSSATRRARHALADLRATRTTAAPTVPAARPATDGATARFVRSGDLWEVTYGGRTAHLAATKGMADLARLLARPGHEIHCLELAGAGAVEPDTGDVIDSRARRAYEQRIRDLQGEIDLADAEHDVGRSERAQAELDVLVDHLTTALGLAGRSRRRGSTAERARSAVTHRLRNAILRITAAHPALGQHLRTSVTTGTYCSYRPVPPVS